MEEFFLRELRKAYSELQLPLEQMQVEEIATLAE